MEKVYFDPEFYGSWVVKDLSDIYTFNYVEGDEEKIGIMTWKKGEHDGICEDDRIFGVDIYGDEFLFVLTYKPEFTKFLLNAKEPFELERLVNEKRIFFVGEKLNLVD